MTDIKTNTSQPNISDEFADAITPYFMEAGFKVIERTKIKLILKELELQHTGITTSDKAIEIGKIANVRYVVFGNGRVKYTPSGLYYFLNSVSVKMINVETGENELIATLSGKGVKPVGAANDIGKEIVKKLNQK